MLIPNSKKTHYSYKPVFHCVYCEVILPRKIFENEEKVFIVYNSITLLDNHITEQHIEQWLMTPAHVQLTPYNCNPMNCPVVSLLMHLIGTCPAWTCSRLIIGHHNKLEWRAASNVFFMENAVRWLQSKVSPSHAFRVMAGGHWQPNRLTDMQSNQSQFVHI